MNLADHFRTLAADMAEARKRAGVNNDSSCWEELEKILAQYDARLNQPTPTRCRPLKPEESIYDRDFQNAIKKGGCFNG